MLALVYVYVYVSLLFRISDTPYNSLFSIVDFSTKLWNVKMPNLFRYFILVLIWLCMLQVISQGSADMLPNLRGAAWDPHNHNSIAAISDSSLHLWDLRSMELILYLDLWFYMLLSVIQLLKCFHYIFIFICQRIILSKSTAIEHAHIRDVDYNPKKQNIIVSMIHIFLSQVVAHVFLYFYTKDCSLGSPFCSNIE